MYIPHRPIFHLVKFCLRLQDGGRDRDRAGHRDEAVFMRRIGKEVQHNTDTVKYKHGGPIPQ